MGRFKMVNMDRVGKISTVLLIASILAFSYFSYDTATKVQGTIGYVSDETWYVTSARNILREIFNVQPSYVDSNGEYHYSLFFYNSYTRDNVRAELESFLKERFDGRITMTYNNTAAYAIVTKKPLDRSLTMSSFDGIKIIQSGYHYSDNNAIEHYLNTEHPPIVKYIIGLSMLTLGDYPISWRIPSIIMGTLTFLLICLIVIKLTQQEIVAFIVVVCVFTDAVFKAMSSIGMLDIYVAFFLTLSAWLAIRGNYLLSGVAIGLATSAKLTGVFPAVALLFLLLILNFNLVKALVYSIIVPFLVWVTTNLPMIVKWGVQGWFDTVINGLKWHVSPRPEGPPVSTPWGWLYNENPFPLHFNPDLAARVNPAIYLIAVLMLIFIPYLYAKGKSKYLVPAFWFGSTFLGYVTVYFLGNKTLYSFYVITLSPMAYVLTALAIYYLGEPSMFKDAIKFYYSYFRRIIKRPEKATPIEQPDSKETL